MCKALEQEVHEHRDARQERAAAMRDDLRRFAQTLKRIVTHVPAGERLPLIGRLVSPRA
jgi:hypothetical protein